MNKKAIHTLEFDKIQEQLIELASLRAAKTVAMAAITETAAVAATKANPRLKNLKA